VIWIWACATVLNIVLNFWAIPRFGLTGASVVSSISYSLVLLAVVMVIIASELRPHLSQPTAS
jgi:O-antigen/teichoic acid export membrane protein